MKQARRYPLIDPSRQGALPPGACVGGRARDVQQGEPVVVQSIYPLIPRTYEEQYERTPSRGERMRRKRRALFHEQGGLCHWCKRPMLWTEGEFPQRKRMPGSACTIDHFYSRLDPRRRRLPQRYVAACSTCNGRRSKLQCSDVARKGCIEPGNDYDPSIRTHPKLRP